MPHRPVGRLKPLVLCRHQDDAGMGHSIDQVLALRSGAGHGLLHQDVTTCFQCSQSYPEVLRVR